MFNASKVARTLFLGVALGAASVITTAAKSEVGCPAYSYACSNGSGGGACYNNPIFVCHCSVSQSCVPNPMPGELP